MAMRANYFTGALILDSKSHRTAPEAVREAAIVALGRIGTPAALQALSRVVRNDALYASRGSAAMQLAKCGDQAALGTVRAAWKKKFTGERHEIWYQGDDVEASALLWSMARLSGHDGVVELVKLLDDPHWSCSALLAATTLMDPLIVPAATDALARHRYLRQPELRPTWRRLVEEQPGSEHLVEALDALDSRPP